MTVGSKGENTTSRSNASRGSHFANGRFRNPLPVREPTFRDFLRWQWERRQQNLPPAKVELPLAGNDPASLRANRTDTTLTWIGHATVLLQLAGRNILTDPVAGASPHRTPPHRSGAAVTRPL
jgi:hypothetical protein